MGRLAWVAVLGMTMFFLGSESAWAGHRGCGGCGHGRRACGGGRHHRGGCGWGGGCGYSCGWGGGCGSGGCGWGGGCGSGGGCGWGGGCGSGGCGWGGCGGYAFADDAAYPVLASIEEAPITLVVDLPEDAQLTVDGQKTVSTSGNRVFQSPPVKIGPQYTYTLQAKVTRNGETRSVTQIVTVRPGEENHVTLDMPATAVARK